MLGKLTKYEFKATARTFPLLFAGLIILSFLCRIFYGQIGYDSDMSDPLGVLSVISTVIYGFLIFGTCAAIIVVAIQRFNKNLLGDEGYLMFTLPVRNWQIIVSKMIVMGVWTFLSLVFITISALILANVSAGVALREIADGFSEMWQVFGPLISIEFFLLAVLSLFVYTLPIFASISIGSLWRKHRILGAFLAYIGISIVTQVVTTNVMMRTVDRYADVDYFYLSVADYNMVMRAQVQQFILPTLILLAVFSALYFVATNWILTHKLDLE